MSPTYPELPGWTFNADEVSANVYRAFGRDRAGRTVEATGTDPDALIQKCRQAALELMTSTHRKNPESGGKR
jgi:hypothetical protein